MGFVSVERVFARHRYVNEFKLSTHWQTIDAVEAKRLAVQAQQSMPGPKPVTKTVQRRQQPSLATIRWSD